MSLRKENAYSLSWTLVNKLVSEELSSIIGHNVSCEAVIDDCDFWSINFLNYRMSLKELNHVLDKVQAGHEMREDSIPDDKSESVKGIGELLSNCLLQRRLGYRWEKYISCNDTLWIVGGSVNNALNIGTRWIFFDQLKTKDELVNWLMENGATHKELMDFCEEYRNEYHNELCWHYPISDGKHLGTYLVLVREGILSLPYDEVDKEDYEVFTLEDACLFRKSSDMSEFIHDWERNSDDLRNTMLAMFNYLKGREDEQIV